VADWGIIALRWALFVSLGLLFGLTAFKRLSLGGDHRPMPMSDIHG
jgi:putative copper resistance protein D